MNALDWTHLAKRYRGQWVALKDDHCTVVGSGATLQGAKKDAQKKGCSQPFLTRVPRTFRNFVGSPSLS